MRNVLLAVALSFAVTSPAAMAEDVFSCPIGKRPSCLDYSDTVCDGIAGKCVNRNAECFSQFTCDFNGFVCKSTLTDLADNYDDLIRKAKAMATEFDDYRGCVTRATTIESARLC